RAGKGSGPHVVPAEAARPRAGTVRRECALLCAVPDRPFGPFGTTGSGLRRPLREAVRRDVVERHIHTCLELEGEGLERGLLLVASIHPDSIASGPALRLCSPAKPWKT